MILNRNFKEELEWWIQNLKMCNGPYLIQSHSQVLIQTDASIKGWGATCQGISTGSQWSKEEQLLHIAPLNFNKQKSLKAVHFQIDNTAALLYLQMLLKLSKEIWQHLSKPQITITAEYLPSSLNVEADWQSRNIRDLSEWKLCKAFGKHFSKSARGEES